MFEIVFIIGFVVWAVLLLIVLRAALGRIRK